MHGLYVGAIAAVGFLTLMRMVSAVFRRRPEAVEA
jgi:hypothetical protein